MYGMGAAVHLRAGAVAHIFAEVFEEEETERLTEDLLEFHFTSLLQVFVHNRLDAAR